MLKYSNGKSGILILFIICGLILFFAGIVSDYNFNISGTKSLMQSDSFQENLDPKTKAVINSGLLNPGSGLKIVGIIFAGVAFFMYIAEKTPNKSELFAIIAIVFFLTMVFYIFGGIWGALYFLFPTLVLIIHLKKDNNDIQNKDEEYKYEDVFTKVKSSMIRYNLISNDTQELQKKVAGLFMIPFGIIWMIVSMFIVDDYIFKYLFILSGIIPIITGLKMMK